MHFNKIVYPASKYLIKTKHICNLCRGRGFESPFRWCRKFKCIDCNGDGYTIKTVVHKLKQLEVGALI